MTTVIGLGNLGLAVARRLAMVGLSPVGVDIDENQRRLWTSLTDAPVVARASDLDLDSLDRVLVVVNGSKPAFRVIQDIVDLPRTTPIVVYVLTTVAPDEAATLSQFNRDSLRMIELPVTGGELGALAGTLVAMAAGPLDEIERDFLNTTIASHVVEFGDYGQPAIAKLLNNVVGAYHLATLAEISNVAVHAGLPLHQFHTVLVHGAGTSYAVRHIFDIPGEMLDHDVQTATDALGPFPRVQALGATAHLKHLRELLRTVPARRDRTQ